MITITLPWWAALGFGVLLIGLMIVDAYRARCYHQLLEGIGEMYDELRVNGK